MKKIAILGGGNLGAAMAEGFLKSGFVKAADLVVTKRRTTTISYLADQGVTVTDKNDKAVNGADVVIVALKPYNVREVLAELSEQFAPSRQVLVSVVTGISLADLASMLPEGLPIFRAMPNTAIAIQESVTCLCHKGGNDAQVKYISELFNQLGISISVDEKLMDAATVLGACGIAFALRFIRAATQGGIEIGFDAKTASLIAAQTVKGAAELLLKGSRHPEAEIDKVTTPKGCTIAGLNEMEHQGFSSSLIKGICASYNKIAV